MTPKQMAKRFEELVKEWPQTHLPSDASPDLDSFLIGYAAGSEDFDCGFEDDDSPPLTSGLLKRVEDILDRLDEASFNRDEEDKKKEDSAVKFGQDYEERKRSGYGRAWDGGPAIIS